MATKASTVWQVRVPSELSDALIADMSVVGAKDRSEMMRIALEHLHREILERRMAEDITTFHDGGPAPLDAVTAALYGDGT